MSVPSIPSGPEDVIVYSIYYTLLENFSGTDGKLGAKAAEERENMVKTQSKEFTRGFERRIAVA